MAADLIMPRLPDYQPPPSFYQEQAQQLLPSQQHLPPLGPLRGNPSQISPISSTSSISPPQTKTYLTRPIRPLYVPAVLRPTEFPCKPAPRKAQPEGPSAEEEDGCERVLRSSGSFISLSGLGALSRLSRRSTGDSADSANGSWNLDMFPKPTGLPTRNHWKPDHASTVCDYATCRRAFSYFTRRHHCRRCGNIFCDLHSAYEVPLDQDANYNPRGIPSRACTYCYTNFKEWRSRTSSQCSTASSSPEIGSGNNPNSATAPPSLSSSPIVASPSPLSTGVSADGTPALRGPDAAMSVPRDWNWSTF
ncbi:hypothetical protein VTK73DRAFT_4633 [Phialemonium thermophilum]|uniref:FYVE-type domain-containing protein n=1 Tax=Phialemonium thermophilum TaxID=223376 RepID=A0ABR3WSQ4_9PEZI